MIVVADTSPINYLVRIGEIEVLPQLYGAVIIPPAVERELRDAPEMVRTWIEHPRSWLQVVAPSPRVDTRLASLDPGEREAILLFEELRADRLVIDERDGREEAARRALPVIGTLGVLQSGAKAGLLNLRDAVEKLRETNFHIAEDLIERILENGR